ncbi:GNAT family N-acetyltransferase [Stappia sp. ICDLI1TA098]
MCGASQPQARACPVAPDAGLKRNRQPLETRTVMQTHVRPATAFDVAGIFHVRTSVTENVLTAAELTDMGITEASITEMINASTCAWVAVENGQIVGFSMIDPDEGSLFAAFVLPSHEGRGIGKALVRFAEEALFQSHANIWLETGRTTRAAGFYRRLGWGDEQDLGAGDIRLVKQRAWQQQGSQGADRLIPPTRNR